MPSSSAPDRPGFVVLGAGGRVGSAVVSALLRRGYDVTAVVRDPSRHAFPSEPRLRIRRGDAQDPGLLSGTLHGASGVVLAVTPFTAPPQTFDGFNRDYYAAMISGIGRAFTAGRLVCVGLTATAELDDGSRFLDHADLFPPFLAPFADAHLRAAPALRRTTLDWAMLVPPAGFGALPPSGQRTPPGYRLRREPLILTDATSALDHATFAEAVADEIVTPTIHKDRVIVLTSETGTADRNRLESGAAPQHQGTAPSPSPAGAVTSRQQLTFAQSVTEAQTDK